LPEIVISFLFLFILISVPILLFAGTFALIPITLLVTYFFEFRATKNLKPY